MTKSEFTNLQDNYIAKRTYFQIVDELADRELDRLLAMESVGIDEMDEKDLDRINEKMRNFDEKVNLAIEEFKEAEQNLLKASIAIAPEANITLEQLNNTTLKNKVKWLSIVLKLDANTIPAKKLARA